MPSNTKAAPAAKIVVGDKVRWTREKRDGSAIKAQGVVKRLKQTVMGSCKRKATAVIEVKAGTAYHLDTGHKLATISVDKLTKLA